jgi:FMN phosphatase YigB (HAD superfamily)
MNNTSKPLMLFDIDLTLYDSLHFRALYPPLMANALNISLQELTRTQNIYLNTLEKSTDFLPQMYLRHIADHYKFPYRQLQAIYYDPGLFRASLYPDTIPALQKLHPLYILGIFTEGNTDFQINKLKYSGIWDYFNQKYIYIHRRKLDPEIIVRMPPNATVVDDRLEVVEKLQPFPRIQPVWLNRKNQITHLSVPTIHKLTDLT